jgi:hypothetical protein
MNDSGGIFFDRKDSDGSASGVGGVVGVGEVLSRFGDVEVDRWFHLR